MLDAHDVDHVVQVFYGIQNGSLTISTQESVVHGNLCYATFLSQCLHLLIRKVTGVIAKRTGATMAAYNRFLANLQSIIETGFSSMTHIHHNAQAVHLLNYLFSKRTQTAMLGIAFGRVTDVVVAVVAECHINNAAFGKVFQLTQVLSDGIAVLYS